MIDTQVHILDPARYPYPDRTNGYRPSDTETGTVDDLLGVMVANGVGRAVLVQPSVYGYDNACVIETAALYPDRFRAVAMAPSDPARLSELAAVRHVCGVRINLTDFVGHGDVGEARAAARAIADTGLFVQIQARPAELVAILAGLEDVPVVIDHMGRPEMSGGSAELEPLVSLSRRRHTFLKVSGLFRLAPEDRIGSCLPDLRRVADAFGSDRLLWGSDWPFINFRGRRPDYRRSLEWGLALIPDLEASNRAAERLFRWVP